MHCLVDESVRTSNNIDQKCVSKLTN